MGITIRYAGIPQRFFVYGNAMSRLFGWIWKGRVGELLITSIDLHPFLFCRALRILFRFWRVSLDGDVHIEAHRGSDICGIPQLFIQLQSFLDQRLPSSRFFKFSFNRSLFPSGVSDSCNKVSLTRVAASHQKCCFPNTRASPDPGWSVERKIRDYSVEIPGCLSI